MNPQEFTVRYYDASTGKLMFTRKQSYPEHRAYVRGAPVRIECDPIEPPHLLESRAALESNCAA